MLVLLASNDTWLLHEIKQIYLTPLRKDLDKASFFLDIEIHRGRSRGMLGLFQIFNMNSSSPQDAELLNDRSFLNPNIIRTTYQKKQ